MSRNLRFSICRMNDSPGEWKAGDRNRNAAPAFDVIPVLIPGCPVRVDSGTRQMDDIGVRFVNGIDPGVQITGRGMRIAVLFGDRGGKEIRGRFLHGGNHPARNLLQGAVDRAEIDLREDVDKNLSRGSAAGADHVVPDCGDRGTVLHPRNGLL